MPEHKLSEFIKRLTKLEKDMTEHLMESGTIKATLKFNTWLTGGIFLAVAIKVILDTLFK